ncbi:contactin-associated protein-like 2 [Clavelina lepadiformis]|uniref:contactin-associated protein-like 2 n=1 Tax=Clavelina lepadiformis TaxID=159417 RepID=UPI004042E24C
MLNIVLCSLFMLPAVLPQTNNPNSSACTGSTHIYYNYAPDHVAPFIAPERNMQRVQGKSGPRGQKGEPGQKGESARTEGLENRLAKVEEELTLAKRQLDALRVPPSTCAYYDELDFESGYYLISPDPTRFQPVYVYCNFSQHSAATIMNHDLTGEIEVERCEARKCSEVSVNYNLPLEVMIQIANLSAECKQYVKFRCQSVFLFRNSPAAAWLSRGGIAMHYWGGATSGRDYYCACGETGSCVDPVWKCNCDKNSAPEALDEGFLTTKDALPVTGFLFGDNGDNEENAWFMLGPLVCTGRQG